MLIKDINRSKFMIAHNLDFDHKVLGAEMLRYNARASVKTQKICTMKSTTDLCCIPGPYGFKWPKLEELHRFLFQEDFSGAHDAMNDVKATMRCFIELVNRGVIRLEKEESFM